MDSSESHRNSHSCVMRTLFICSIYNFFCSKYLQFRFLSVNHSIVIFAYGLANRMMPGLLNFILWLLDYAVWHVCSINRNNFVEEKKRCSSQNNRRAENYRMANVMEGQKMIENDGRTEQYTRARTMEELK